MGCGHIQIKKTKEIEEKFQGGVVILSDNSPTKVSPTLSTSPFRKEKLCSIHQQLSLSSGIKQQLHHHSDRSTTDQSSNKSNDDDTKEKNKILICNKVETFEDSDNNFSKNISFANTKSIENEYLLQKKLGSYSEVFKGVHISSKKRVAIKVIPHNNDKAEIENIEKEAQVLSKIDHPNILKIFDLFYDNDNVYIVTEYCSGESLKDVIKKNRLQPISDENVIFWTFQIMSAINYCHFNHIIHRDLKPENILFANKKKNLIKIIDFGFSLNKDDIKSKEVIKGTPYYMAPEQVFQERQICTEKCDVWSIGVILYYLIFKKKPFRGVGLTELFISIKNKGNIFEELQCEFEMKDQAIDLLSKLLEKDFEKRITIFEALQHTIFDSVKTMLQCKKSIIQNVIQFKDKFAQGRNQVLRCSILKLLIQKVINQKKFQDIINCFYSLDVNFNGFVEKQQMQFVIEQIYQNKEEVEKICNSIYHPKISVISYSDFFLRGLNFESFFSDNILFRCFKMLDSEDQGLLKKQTIENFLIDSQLLNNSEELNKILDKKSKQILNKSKNITFENFKELFS